MRCNAFSALTAFAKSSCRFSLLFLALPLAAQTLAVAPIVAPLTATQVRQMPAQIRSALFIPERLPRLDAKVHGRFSPAPGVIAERVTYASQFGLRIPAIIYRPEKVHGRLPGIVLVNGHGADKSSWYSWYTGILYARAGAVVLTYDPLGEGERNDEHKDGTGEHDTPAAEPTMPQRTGGAMVTDVMQGVSYLISRPDVASNRIGVLGFSMGSFITAIAGAVDTRINAMLLVGGGDLDGPGGYWDTTHSVMCESGPYHALEFLGDRGATLFALRARRGATFIVNGTADTVVAIPKNGPAFFADLRQRTIALNGSERNVFTTHFDEGASHRPALVTPLAAAWLADQLHFAHWSSTQIAALPTVKIGDWAAKNNFILIGHTAWENRDAGLIAVDIAAPILTPEQLSVLPLAEWQKQRAQFVYSSWSAATLADASKGGAVLNMPGQN